MWPRKGRVEIKDRDIGTILYECDDGGQAQPAGSSGHDESAIFDLHDRGRRG